MLYKKTRVYKIALFAFSIVLSLAFFTSIASSAERSLLAQSLLHASGVKGGMVVHLNCADAALTAALHADERYIVQGLDGDAAHIDALRRLLGTHGLYGAVSARRWEGASLPYTENLINLVILSKGKSRVSKDEIMRVLAPRGVLLTQIPMPGAEPSGIEGWQKITKPVPSEIDDWTHYLHDSGNNAVANDTRVGPPEHIQWKAGPMWCRSHEYASSVLTLVSAKGRLIGIIDEGIIGQPRGVPPFWTLVARDSFNGVLLWKRPIARINPHALAAVGDRVYVTLTANGPLQILDAATGKTLHTGEETGDVSEISVSGNKVILTTRLKNENGKTATHIAAASPEDARILWKTPVKKVGANTMVAGEGRVCYYNGEELVCLDLEKGGEVWRTAAKGGDKGYAIMYQGSVFVTGSGTRAFSLATGEPLWTGPNAGGRAPGLFGANGLMWRAWAERDGRSFIWDAKEETRNGFDAVTGEICKTISVERLVTAGHHIRCYPPKATVRYLLLNKRGVEFFDLQGDNHMRTNWTRGACRFGVLPANGLLYTPPNQCFCYPGAKLDGFHALAAKRSAKNEGTLIKDSDRLEQGPAFGKIHPSSFDLHPSKDWPTYRHDAKRSGSTQATLPVKLKRLWETPLCDTNFGFIADEKRDTDAKSLSKKGDSPRPDELRAYPRGGISPPVAAGDRIYVAEPDAHKIHCLDGKTGENRWSFTADGRIDSPPTIYKGRVLFGSADGHAYCLDAVNGALAWRFMAAPEDRQISIFSQFESPWPVHGSILVRDGLAYLTAGRSSFIDGGIYVYALDIETGKIVHQTRLKNEKPDVTQDGGRPFDIDGTNSDLLVSGKEDIHMLLKRFNLDLTLQEMPRITKLGDRETEAHLMPTGGFLDTTWFNRTYWTYSDRWPGYYFSYRGPKSGQILVFNDAVTYALKVYTVRHGHSPEFVPGAGYQLYADRNTTKPVLDAMDIGAEKGRGYTRTEHPVWSKKVSIRAMGMLLAGERLYIVGPPDLWADEGAYEAMIGRKGSTFRVVSASDGETLSEFKMEQTPVFDGLIAASDRLYMSTMDGKLVCFGKGE